MYSPKIREDLIPRIYRAAKSARIAMTKWVNNILEGALQTEPEIQPGEASARKENDRP